MKTTILGLAFLTIASFSINASAQQKTQSTENCKFKTECVAKNKKCQKDCKECKDCKNVKNCKDCKNVKNCKDCKNVKNCKDSKNCKKGKVCKKKADFFEGITLTTEQKSRIDALNNASKVSRQELNAKAKKARENKDTTFNPRNAHKELRSKYINDLGEILTSDQMVVYLKNFYVNSGSHHNGKKAVAMKQGKGHKGGNFHKDGKCNRQGKALRQMQSASK